MHLAQRLGKQVGSLAISFANLVSEFANLVSGADFANLVSELANQVIRAHCYDKSPLFRLLPTLLTRLAIKFAIANLLSVGGR